LPSSGNDDDAVPARTCGSSSNKDVELLVVIDLYLPPACRGLEAQKSHSHREQPVKTNGLVGKSIS